MGHALSTYTARDARGVARLGTSRLADPSGNRHTPLGQSWFESVMRESFFLDKSLLVKDIVEGAAVTLFCRPRRFGKSLAISMLKSFFEIPVDGVDCRPLFEGLCVWDVDGGVYRGFQGAHPVVFLTLSQAKQMTWSETHADLKNAVMQEYNRHSYLLNSEKLGPVDRDYCGRMINGEHDDADLRQSLKMLVSLLARHHESPCVVLIDEYDAPVMAGESYGYRDEAVVFLRTWLTGALKDGEASVWRACLTGVQRVTGESLFSDLNNIDVNTPLSYGGDERFGLTAEEVRLLALYLGHAEKTKELAAWYDGYRFGGTDVYNPWSVLSYFHKGCRPAPYWVNTSSNTVLGRMLASADPSTWDDVISLVEPGETVARRLNLNAVFRDFGADQEALWSLLYLSGYVTTDDTGNPDDRRALRRLRVPNREVASVFGDEIVARYESRLGQRPSLDLQSYAVAGDAESLRAALQRVLDDHLGFFDLTSENSCHNLLFGLLLGTPGYEATSERKRAIGRYDIRLEPDPRLGAGMPVVTIEVKWLGKDDRPDDIAALDERLTAIAQDALGQIARRGYDEADIAAGRPCVRLGLGFSPARVAVLAERL